MSQTESKHSLIIILLLSVNVEESSDDITVSVLVLKCLLKHMDAWAVLGTLFSKELCFFYNFSLSPLTSCFFLSLVFFTLFSLLLAYLKHLKSLRHLFDLFSNPPASYSFCSLYLTFLLFKSLRPVEGCLEIGASKRVIAVLLFFRGLLVLD